MLGKTCRRISSLALFVATVLAAATSIVTWSPKAYANDPSLVRARPRIAGDMFPEIKVEDVTGNVHMLSTELRDKYTMIAFVPIENFGQKNLAAYFSTIRSYIEGLGYQIVIIATKPLAQQRAALYQRKLPNLFIDPDRSAFIAMGLADSKDDKAAVVPAFFFVAPSGKLLSVFASVDPNIPFSGDALVLSARIYKQIEEKNRASGVRSGPTLAPVMTTGPHVESAFDPASSSVDISAASAQPVEGAFPVGSEGSFAAPDESVLRLLTVDDVARTNSYWVQGGVGVTAYDARRDTWSPRWSPGFQFGRRFNRLGVFANLALDQTFDLTQEIKRLDVIHVGIGIESLSLYGRVRTSFSTGLAILNSDTDIDSRGKVGWYADLRPLALRWGTGRRGVLEFVPLGLNISVPVTRGIPLILVGYMTTLSFEWASEPRP